MQTMRGARGNQETVYTFNEPVQCKAGVLSQFVFDPAWTEDPEGDLAVKLVSVSTGEVLWEGTAHYKVKQKGGYLPESW